MSRLSLWVQRRRHRRDLAGRLRSCQSRCARLIEQAQQARSRLAAVAAVLRDPRLSPVDQVDRIRQVVMAGDPSRRDPEGPVPYGG